MTCLKLARLRENSAEVNVFELSARYSCVLAYALEASSRLKSLMGVETHLMLNKNEARSVVDKDNPPVYMSSRFFLPVEVSRQL
jgi:hypothetical protein